MPGGEMFQYRHRTSHIPRGLWRRKAIAWALATAGIIVSIQAQIPEEEPPTDAQTAAAVAAAVPPADTLFIKEYRVIGTKTIPRADVETAVYEFLGPARTAEDVEKARASLEKAYRDKGFQSVSVNVPPQRPTRGIVVLQVTETPVGRLRVKGATFFSPEQIRRMAPSLAEGKVPNFNEVQRDLIALNQMPDRQITPTLRPGVLPGTIDVDLEVKDKLPLHGSIELNNRYSANTTPLRLDAAVRYDNLWQLGHTIGFGFQIAPQRPSDAIIYSGYYIARLPQVNWVSLLIQGTRQNSEVATSGGANSIGNGEIIGGRFLFNLPSRPGFFHSASAGIDYKNFEQDLQIGSGIIQSPISYWPFSVGYNASWIAKNYLTELSAGLTFSFRGTSAQEVVEFDNRRYNADANFFYFRGSLGHTHELPYGFQFFGELQGQASATPLVDSEQFSIGGLTTVRGYLESTSIGDSGLCGTLEIRTPSLLKWLGEGNELRFFAFLDGGFVTINDPLPEQTSHFNLWSYGFGGSIRLLERLTGSVVIGFPQITQLPNIANEPLITFRLSAEL
jgi:hemolysin activation/secretion protein